MKAMILKSYGEDSVFQIGRSRHAAGLRRTCPGEDCGVQRQHRRHHDQTNG